MYLGTTLRGNGMSIEQEIRQPVVSAYIELLQIDVRIEGELTSYYYTPMTNGSSAVQWNYKTYLPFPFQLEGVSFATDAAPARPTLIIANVLPGKLFGTLAFLHGDLVGMKVYHTKTLGNYLGISSNIKLKQTAYTIGRKISHNRQAISFELRSPQDKDRSVLPRRQMLKKDFPGLGIIKKT